jgi:two-component system, cell cycle response regulator
MPEARFSPITARLTRAILLWGLTGTLLAGVLVGLQVRRDAESQLRAELQVYGERLASSLVHSVFNIMSESVQDQLSTAELIPGVGFVAVVEGRSRLAEAGDLALRSRADALEFPIVMSARQVAAINGPAPEGSGTTRGGGVGLSPHMAGRQFGVLKIVIDEAALNRDATHAAIRTVVPCLLLTGLALAITWLVVRRHLQRPMRELAGFVQRLDATGLDERLQLSRRSNRTRDEMDLMAAGFASLQDRLAGHVRELDARVAERTEQLQVALDKLKVLAITDSLTGCHNRLAFDQKFPEAVAHAERYGRPLSLVFCDADRFKSINDNHGHPVGDQVLAAIGQYLRDALRASSDWVARYGGEEFLLVLPETPLSQAQDVAERLRLQIEQALVVALPDGKQLRVTASLGVAEYRGGERGEDLLRRADEQLYAAKQGGRNQVWPPLAVTA